MSVKISLCLNLGFATSRYPEPEQWAKLVREEFGLGHVQFTSDLLQPSLPYDIIKEQVGRINESMKRFDIESLHTFTSPKWNFFANPDEKIRAYMLWWFKRFAKISRDIGAVSTGSRPGDFSVYDLQYRKEFILREVVKNWHSLAEYSKHIGLKFLAIETMSIRREMAETIEETKYLMDKLNGEKKPSIPILLCLDVDHGDVSSRNPDDTNPYAWIMAFGKDSPAIHIKQRTKNVFGHKPFIEEYNKEGTITPERIIEALDDAGVKETMLILELSFREREPFESNLVRDIKESVKYWKPFADE